MLPDKKTGKRIFNNTKSQGISMNVIIIAAIALVVLIVLIAIFTGRFGLFSKGLEECRGKCVPRNQCQAIAPEGGCDTVSSQQIGDVFRISSSEGGTVCCLLEK